MSDIKTLFKKVPKAARAYRDLQAKLAQEISSLLEEKLGMEGCRVEVYDNDCLIKYPFGHVDIELLEEMMKLLADNGLKITAISDARRDGDRGLFFFCEFEGVVE